MENLILAAHIVIGLTIIVFVLLQQGKGAEAGASFGAGASQTLFGSVGTWNFFSKVTAILALGFFITSFTLAVLASKNTGVDSQLLPELEMLQEIPGVDDLPGAELSGSSEIPDLEVSELEVPDLEGSGLDDINTDIDSVDQQLPSQP
ncbi:MAG: preprotein translocase subunit SecG [Porticoccaceae bacterium]|nr:preprotein translocase subunit SecG [Porticoccaceae bacterium]